MSSASGKTPVVPASATPLSLGSFEAAAFDSCKITVNITHIATNSGVMNVGCTHAAEAMTVDDDNVYNPENDNDADIAEEDDTPVQMEEDEDSGDDEEEDEEEVIVEDSDEDEETILDEDEDEDDECEEECF